MKVLWHCEDRAGAAMAGPAIRAAELCARLTAHHEVTLACPGASDLPAAPFRTVELEEGSSIRPLLRDLAGGALVTQGFGFPLRDLTALPADARLVLDLYDPVQLELLARYGPRPAPEQRLHLAVVRRRLLLLLGRADHVLCASQRQRAFWLGWLGAAGRLTPDALAGDPQATSLLAVVPFGIAAGSRKPEGGSPLRALHGPDELPVLWWGGLWDWMDPVTAVRAIERVRRAGIPAALVLPAANRPGGAPMEASRLAEQEARVRGLWGPGRGVAALAEWVPYEQRAAVLGAAAVALSCHRPSLEAELAFRTRLLDCVWAGLPAVATAGDDLSARAEREGWAVTAAPGDVDAIAAALLALLPPESRARAREAAERARPAYAWEASAAALQQLLSRPASLRPGLVERESSGAGPLAVLKAAAGKLTRRRRRSN